jgi:hypothetical protein
MMATLGLPHGHAHEAMTRPVVPEQPSHPQLQSPRYHHFHRCFRAVARNPVCWIVRRRCPLFRQGVLLVLDSSRCSLWGSNGREGGNGLLLLDLTNE